MNESSTDTAGHLRYAKAAGGSPSLFWFWLQVVTAKSSELNLVLVAADPSAEDVVEHPVPEQFISTFKDGKLITTAASHGGG